MSRTRSDTAVSTGLAKGREIHTPATRFVSALLALDAISLKAVTDRDMCCTLLGSGRMSGPYTGVEATVEAVKNLYVLGLIIAAEHVLTGRDRGVAILRVVGSRDGRTLDIRMKLSLTMKNDRISAVSARTSELAAYNSYLA